jgi:alpha-ketoglutarate-dependent taurine dioxygenase
MPAFREHDSVECRSRLSGRRFVCEHLWRPADILMWDNRCTLQARTDFSAGERRCCGA